MRAWRKALKKREILKGMKFTACFKHNQWLMKKVVLTLAKRVHSSMMQRIKQVEIIERVNRLKAGKVIDSWKLYVNLRLKSKIFYLKSQKFTIKYLLARGLRKLQLGIEVNKAQQDLIERANTHYKKKLFTKTIHVWFSSIVNNCRKKVKIEQAEKFYEDRLKNWVFQCLKFISEYWQTEFEEKINEYKKKKTNNILVQWRSKSVNNSNKKFAGIFYYIVFYLLMPYNQIPINNFEFSNISQRINRKKIARSNNLLKTYVNDKLFTHWKNYTITIKSKKTNLHKARLKKIFIAWRDSIESKQYNKFLLEKLLQQKKARRLSKILNLWHQKYSKIVNNKRKYKGFCINKKVSSIKYIFSNWLKKSNLKIRHKREKALVPIFSRNLLSIKYLRIWNQRFIKQQKHMQMNHTAKKHLIEKLISHSWSKWRRLFIEKLKLDFNSTKLIEIYSENLIKKCFKGWRQTKHLLRSKNFKKAKALDQLEYVLKIKSVKSWKDWLPYIKSKKALYDQLLQNRNTILKKEILRYLSIYAKYRQKNAIRDKMLTTEITKIRKKSTLAKWYKKALLFSSMRYFEKIFVALQKKEVLFKIARFIEIQKVTIAYVDIHREESIVKTVFSLWKRFITKRKILMARAGSFKKVKGKYSILKPFKSWRRLYIKKASKIKVLADVLENTTLYSVKKRILVWKKQTKRANSSNFAYIQRSRILKKIFFNALKKLLDIKQQFEKRSHQFYKKHLRNLCLVLLKHWIQHNNKQLDQKKVIRTVQNYKLARVIGSWRVVFMQQRRLREIIYKVKGCLSDMRKKMYLRHLYLYRSSRIHMKKLSSTGMYLHRMRIKSSCFTEWKSEVFLRKDTEIIRNKIIKTVNRNITSVFFNNWLILLKKKGSLENLGEIFCAYNNRDNMKAYFNRFIDFNDKCKIIQEKQNSLMKQVRVKKVRDSMKRWSRSVRKNKNCLSAYKKTVTKNNKRNLKLYFQQWNILLVKNRTSNEKAKGFIGNRSRNIKKIVYSALQKHLNLSKKISKNFAILAKRLMKQTTFCSINQTLATTLIKHKLYEKLSQHEFTKKQSYLKFALKTLKLNSTSRKSAIQNQALASDHLYSHLVRKYYKKLQIFKHRSKHIKQSSVSILPKISTFIEKKQTLNIFTLFKNIYLSQKHKEIRISEELTNSYLKRIMQTWLQQARSKAKLLYKQDIVSLRHDTSMQKLLFARWIKAFQHKNITRKVNLKHKYATLKCFLRLWRIEFQLQEIEKKRLRRYLVYSFAGLQIYSEKTFQATACLKRVKIYDTFNFVTKLFRSWKEYTLLKKKEQAAMRLSRFKVTRYVMDVLKNHYYLKVISREVLQRCEKMSISKFFNKWQVKLKGLFRRRKIIRNSLMRKSLKLKQYAFCAWLPRDPHSSLEETRIKSEYYIRPRQSKAKKAANIKVAAEHHQSNLISSVFYAWDSLISQHSVKRRRAFLHSIFLGWKIVTRENSLLKKYLLESGLSERYLRNSMEIGLGTLKSISSLGSLASNN